MAIIGNIHYVSINDMAWEGNRKLIVCSSDGYCSIITFDNDGEIIGERLPNNEIPEKLEKLK